MLDALVAEARLRWGFEPAQGRQVVVPVGVPRAAPPGGPAGDPLPGRAGPAARDALAVLRRLYPPDHPVGRFGAVDGATVSSLASDAVTGPLYLAPIAPE